MIRLLLIAALVSLACRWIFGKWPWQYLDSRPPRAQSLAQARQLLGVAPQADAREIREAHRRLSADSHPDRGGSHASQSELNAARDLLLSNLPTTPESPQ